MSTNTLHRTNSPKKERKGKTHLKGLRLSAGLPSLKAAVARVGRLTAAAMPWLSKDVDLAPQEGGPEVMGPVEYERPQRHSK